MIFAALFGKWHKFAPDSRCYHVRHAIRKYADWFVRRRLRQMSSLKMEEASDERFVLLNELSQHTQDPTQFRDETTGILAAGRASIAELMSCVA